MIINPTLAEIQADPSRIPEALAGLQSIGPDPREWMAQYLAGIVAVLVSSGGTLAGPPGPPGPAGATGAQGPPGPIVPATATTLGAVKMGSGCTIAADGTLSVP